MGVRGRRKDDEVKAAVVCYDVTICKQLQRACRPTRAAVTRHLTALTTGRQPKPLRRRHQSDCSARIFTCCCSVSKRLVLFNNIW